MKRKTYDRIKRWSKRHGGAFYSNQGVEQYLTWGDALALTWHEATEWFNAARVHNTAAVTRPK